MTVSLNSNYLTSFPKLWELLDVFQYCTIHLFWMNNLSTNIQENVLKFNSTAPHQPLFIFIHNYNYIETRSVYDSDENIEFMSQTNLKQLSSIYAKVFTSSKFISVCTVQFPALHGLGQDNLEKYFDSLDYYRLSVNQNHTLHTANYIILPVNNLAKKSDTLILTVNALQVNSKFILVPQFENTIYIQCPPTLLYCWNQNDGELRWISLKRTIKLEIDIRSIWKDLYPKVKVPIDKWQTGSRLWEAKHVCPFVRNHWNPLSIDQSFANEKCVQIFIGASLNCTSNSCQDLVRYFYAYESYAGIHYNPEKIQNCFPFGSQSHGYRYSVFVYRRYNKANTNDFNVFKLLSPFSKLGWFVLLATILFLGCTLKITRIQGNPYYWLYAVIIEQHDDRQSSTSFHNWYLVILWLYACHLLRSQYTSSLYTYMTKVSNPSGIPDSLNELLKNSSMHIITDPHAATDLDAGQKTSGYKEMEANFWENINGKLLFYQNNYKNIFTLAYSGKKLVERYLCRRQWGIFISGNKNLREYKRQNRDANPKYPELKCLSFNRFAWLYQTRTPGYDYSLYYKLLLLLFGEYFIVENNDSVLFPELHLWCSRETNYLSDAFSSILGSLVESGLYAYHNHYLDIARQMMALNKFLLINKFNQSWSWFSLVNQMISKNVPFAWYTSANRRLSETLSVDETTMAGEIVGNMNDFRYIWILYGAVNVLLFMLFLFERAFKILFVWCQSTLVYL